MLVAVIVVVLIVIAAAWHVRRNANNSGAAIPQVITNTAKVVLRVPNPLYESEIPQVITNTALRAGAGAGAGYVHAPNALASVPATYTNRMFIIGVETPSTPTDGDGSGIAPANGGGDSQARAGSMVYAIPMEDVGGDVGGSGASASSSNGGTNLPSHANYSGYDVVATNNASGIVYATYAGGGSPAPQENAALAATSESNAVVYAVPLDNTDVGSAGNSSGQYYDADPPDETHYQVPNAYPDDIDPANNEGLDGHTSTQTTYASSA